jgi:DNA-binding LacI/PurR family transcriptional regulator
VVEPRAPSRAAAEARGKSLEIIEFGPFAPHFEAGQHAADLAVAAEVTAVVAFNDLLALGVLSRLADRGIGVPDEISVVGFDDIPMAAWPPPSDDRRAATRAVRACRNRAAIGAACPSRIGHA